MNKLVIGSANFGMNYGYLNSGKKLNPEVVSQLLDYAWLNNVESIDTAEVYGESETVVGNYLKINNEKNFKIITKFIPTTTLSKQLNQSLKYLHRLNIYGVLMHSFEHFKKDHSLFDHLVKFQSERKCEKIGFSLYYPEELQYILDNRIPMDIIQVGYSIFDRRFEKFFPILKEIGVEIHVRSIFLQGLYFTNPSLLGHHFDRVQSKLKVIHKLSTSSGLSIASICLNFVNSNNYIDKIVIGVENLYNLKNNIHSLNQQTYLMPYIELLNELSIEDVDILFPHHWKLQP